MKQENMLLMCSGAHTCLSVRLLRKQGLQKSQCGSLQRIALANQQPPQVRAQLREQAGQVGCPAGQRAQRH